MFKFLRKYNKTLLAVFGVLLMITFLIPQAFNRFSQQAGQRSGTIATVGDGQNVSAIEWDRYQRELQVLEKLARMQRIAPLPGLGNVDKPEQWYLLVREAKQAGVVPVLEMGSAPTQALQQLMAATQERDPEIIISAQAHYVGVAQLLDLYSTGDLYSDRRLRSAAERLLHGVTARTVVIEADADRSDLQPTPQQIEEQMHKYADKLPGGDTGFGYKLPDRVKIEWLKVSAEAVRNVVQQSDAMDPVQQRLHWKRNPNKNLPPYPTDGSAPPIPAGVTQDLLRQLTKAKLEEIAKTATDTLRMAQRGLPEKDGYLELPADWASRAKPLPQLAEELRKRFAIELPEYTARGDKWLTNDDLAALPGIGSATSDKVGAQPVNFVTLVKAAKEFGGNPTIIIQAGVASPPLKDAQDDLYFFRITQADPSHNPASVDEVRDQVVRDLKRMAEYEKLKASLASIESQARTAGLLQTALDHNTIVQAPAGIYLWNERWVQMLMQYRMPLRPQLSSLPVVGQDRKAIEAIIDRALQLPMDKPADQWPAEQRIFAVASDAKLAVVAVEIVQQHPLTRESFERLVQMGGIQEVLSTEESQEQRSVEKAFAFDALAKRNNFAMKQREGEPTKPLKPASDGEEPS